MHRQELSIALEPAQNGADVVIALLRFDSAKKRVLKQPVELLWRSIPKEISYLVLRRQFHADCFFPAKLNGRGGQIESKCLEPGFGPGADDVLNGPLEPGWILT